MKCEATGAAPGDEPDRRREEAVAPAHRPAAAAAPQRILFIRLSAVGDVINTLPALTALRLGLPDARIGFAVEDRASDLIAGHPHVDRVHITPRRRWARYLRNPLLWGTLLREMTALRRELRGEQYDVALDCQGNLRGALHGLASGAARRIGFSRHHCREWSHLFTHEQVSPPPGPLHRVDKFLHLARALAGEEISTDGTATYALPEAKDSRQRAGDFRATAGLRDYLIIHPGTSETGRAKRWIPERFGELAHRIGATHQLPAVVTWGPGERELAQRVVDASKGYAVLSIETTTLLDLAEMLRPARLFVGCDSGPLHLASALAVPSVALFGPKDPRVYGPRSPASRVVYKPTAADSGGDPMQSIAVDEVYAAATALLASLD